MKITSAKRDDILKRKADYEADKAKRQAKYNEQYQAYSDETNSRQDKIKNDIIGAIGDTPLDINIDVRTTFRARNNYEVIVSDEHDKFNPDKALSWEWRVTIDDDGEVKKESSSWSGLQAVTAKNLSNLKEIVRVLEILNKIDFKMLLEEVTPPNYTDYVTENNPMYDDHENFDRELLEADVEDTIGNRQGILGTGSKFYRGKVYHFIQKETPSSYTMWDIPAYYVDNAEGSISDLFEKYSSSRNTYSMRKDKFFETIDQPMKVVDFD